jgi:hypothetical protein
MGMLAQAYPDDAERGNVMGAFLKFYLFLICH